MENPKATPKNTHLITFKNGQQAKVVDFPGNSPSPLGAQFADFLATGKQRDFTFQFKSIASGGDWDVLVIDFREVASIFFSTAP